MRTELTDSPAGLVLLGPALRFPRLWNGELKPALTSIWCFTSDSCSVQSFIALRIVITYENVFGQRFSNVVELRVRLL